MKKLRVALFLALAMMMTTISYAEGDAQQCAVSKSCCGVVSKVGDWFATVGKSDEKKAAIKAERQATREAKKAAKMAEKEAKKAAKAAEEVAGDLKAQVSGN